METQESSLGIRLLKKGQKGLIHAIFSRFGVLLILLLIQFFILFSLFYKFEQFLPQYTGATTIFSIVMVLYLVNSDINPTAKTTWLIIVMIAPIVGSLLFVFTRMEFGHRVLRARLEQLIKDTHIAILQDEEVLEEVEKKAPEMVAMNRYLNRSGCFPIYDQCDVKYFPSGESKFEELLKQLKEAKHFIFLEYFIIDEGVMWGKVLEILKEKAEEGVEVRVMYDGTCEFSLLPHDYPKRLKQLGIKCKAFAPVSPFVSTHYNYRDHRKILVIDGHTAFTGGINLADEYINLVNRFGHWKDTAIMIKGEAVKSFTLMFLQMWNVEEKQVEFYKYLGYLAGRNKEAKGYVMPYGDWPLDNDKVGESVYIDILNHAGKYVHIMSPYLILDGEMEHALKYAAKRGVEVKLILPGIPDKKAPYALAKTHYKALLEAGVRIYEYTPGFVHAKVFVCDDYKAVVGTINLDYRSLYHHFECAAYLYEVECIGDIEKDFQETLKQCHAITRRDVKREKLYYRIAGILMKIVAPLL